MQKNAYNKWRDASNYIANSILNDACAKGYNVAHGSTSTSPAIASLYKGLKQKNYKIVLLLCYAPDATRVASLDHRATVQGFLQVAADDVVSKGKMFSERFPVYFANADEIYLYWTDDFLQGSIHAATYCKGKELVVHNQQALASFIAKYDQDRSGSTLPSWNELLTQ